MADRFTHIGVPETKIAGIDPGNDLADEDRAGGGGKVDRGNGIPQHIDAEGHGDVGHKFTDDPRHGSGGFGLDRRQVGQAVLVRKHDRIDAALLQVEQILPRQIHDILHPAHRVIGRVARQCLKMAHGDDRFPGSKTFFKPSHNFSLRP